MRPAYCSLPPHPLQVAEGGRAREPLHLLEVPPRKRLPGPERDACGSRPAPEGAGAGAELGHSAGAAGWCRHCHTKLAELKRQAWKLVSGPATPLRPEASVVCPRVPMGQQPLHSLPLASRSVGSCGLSLPVAPLLAEPLRGVRVGGRAPPSLDVCQQHLCRPLALHPHIPDPASTCPSVLTGGFLCGHSPRGACQGRSPGAFAGQLSGHLLASLWSAPGRWPGLCCPAPWGRGLASPLVFAVPLPAAQPGGGAACPCTCLALCRPAGAQRRGGSLNTALGGGRVRGAQLRQGLSGLRDQGRSSGLAADTGWPSAASGLQAERRRAACGRASAGGHAAAQLGRPRVNEDPCLSALLLDKLPACRPEAERGCDACAARLSQLTREALRLLQVPAGREDQAVPHGPASGPDRRRAPAWPPGPSVQVSVAPAGLGGALSTVTIQAQQHPGSVWGAPRAGGLLPPSCLAAPSGTLGRCFRQESARGTVQPRRRLTPETGQCGPDRPYCGGRPAWGAGQPWTPTVARLGPPSRRLRAPPGLDLAAAWARGGAFPSQRGASRWQRAPPLGCLAGVLAAAPPGAWLRMTRHGLRAGSARAPSREQRAR
ncbi:Kinesin-like protein KIF26A [Galemys pyrenaicus]|uniref:Kinesin-like protein KIF26A n=1 Tax=Galemys pyrenaicus TaxID=202257 RepID=A0A8J6DNB3_GALPY|nr:Kinesin-like protein KIF26A [Galemys pyrenaicus]